MTNKHNNVLYTGFTNDIYRRCIEHKNGYHPKSFTKRYNVFKLVYYETHYDWREAYEKEKLIKKWKRSWKEDLINTINPEWNDLYKNFLL